MIENHFTLLEEHLEKDLIDDIKNQTKTLVDIVFDKDLDYQNTVKFFHQLDELMSQALFSGHLHSLLYLQAIYSYLEEAIHCNIEQNKPNPLDLQVNFLGIYGKKYLLKTRSKELLVYGLVRQILPQDDSVSIKAFYDSEMYIKEHNPLFFDEHNLNNIKKNCYIDIMTGYYLCQDNPIEAFDKRQKAINPFFEAFIEKRHIENSLSEMVVSNQSKKLKI